MRLTVLPALLAPRAEHTPVHKAKDRAALWDFAGKSTRPILDELIEEDDRNPRCKSILEGCRWGAVSAWPGSLSEARNSPRIANVAFGEYKDRPMVVKLVREGAARFLDNIARVSRQHFPPLSKEPPK